MNDELRRLTEMCAELVPGCAWATVVDLAHGRQRTLATNAPEGIELDAAQFAEDSGPTLAAARLRRQVRLDSVVAGVGRYEMFRSACADVGVRAVVAIPLGEQGVGRALTCYSTTTDAFDDDAAARAAELAEQPVASP